MLACMREGLEKQLLEWVKSDDGKDRDRMMKNAQAVANRGMDAILALMGRGIGEATCQRLMRKVQRGDTEGLLEAIHIAEIEYARTRRFWGCRYPIPIDLLFLQPLPHRLLPTNRQQ